MASSSTLSFIIQALRSATNRSDHSFNPVVTITDVKMFSCIDVKLAASSTLNAVNFGSLTNLVGLFVFTSKKIGLHVNGSSAPVVECGSFYAALDTNISSLHIDNNLLATPAENIIEVWIVTKT